MKIANSSMGFNLESIPIRKNWCNDSKKVFKMHKIHVYPAKFPPLVVNEAFDQAKLKGVKINTVVDIFCGCGTTALEASLRGVKFWGCDINPIATLISKVKSNRYSADKLVSHFDKIRTCFNSTTIQTLPYYLQHQRINYWFGEKQIHDLYKLLYIIKKEVPKGKYRNFFLCAFSSILKSTSRWLAKSIKPQIDPIKIPQQVDEAFENHFYFMLCAVKEINRKSIYIKKQTVQIQTQNLLNKRIRKSFADILITSPPYVTSYEYADLHQLSTLWLGYTQDYRELRKGSIGSQYDRNISGELLRTLNQVGAKIYLKLCDVDKHKAKAVAKYFIDISKAASQSYKIVNKKGLALFVIGNTKYKGVNIDNAKYLITCMFDVGFRDINVIKRKISNKYLTPYRDKSGKFSKNKKGKKVYSHEFIVTGVK